MTIRKPSLEALEQMSEEELTKLEELKCKVHEENLKMMTSHVKRWIKKKLK